MINGKTIYGKNGEVMLHDKVEIKQEYIEKIANLGYSGIYILDDISKDIEVVDIIKNTLKINTVQQIKDVYIKTACNDSNDKNFNKILLLAENIVGQRPTT